MAQPVSSAFADDALQPMPDADLLRYRDVCAKRLPADIIAHHFLTVQYRWKQLLQRPENDALAQSVSPKCLNAFYAPRTRNTEHCTFVAISGEMSVETAPRFCIYAFTLEWPPTELMACLRDTMRIQWRREPLIEALAIELVPIITNLLAEKDCRACEHWTESSNCVWLPKKIAAAFHVKYDFAIALNM